MSTVLAHGPVEEGEAHLEPQEGTSWKSVQEMLFVAMA
jgi:hypothetical protein